MGGADYLWMLLRRKYRCSEWVGEMACVAALWTTAIRILIVQLLFLGGGLVDGLSTVPSTVNGTGKVAAPENTENVRIYCEVTSSPGNVVTTTWRIGPAGMQRTFIDFGAPAFANFMVVEALQTNFTILSFERNLDMMELECTAGFGTDPDTAVFTLRIIG